MTPDRERRPAVNRAPLHSLDAATLADYADADLAMRCAWLRVHADLLRDFDDSGQLTAHLFDFADLLEVAQREGWWRR